MVKFISKLYTNIVLIKLGLTQLMVYKFATWLNFFSSLLLIIIQYYFWRAVYEVTLIPEYSFKQMFSYICFSQIIFVFFPETSGNLSQLVLRGDIIHWLLKPISIIRQFFFEDIGKSIYRLFYISLPILLLVLLVFRVIPNVMATIILKFFVVLILSYIFAFLFEFFIGLCSFYTVNTWGIQSFKYAIITLLSGRFLPITLYPAWLKNIIDILPFKIMFYYPLMILINKTIQSFFTILLYQIVWIIIFIFFIFILYRTAIKKLSIQGG